MEKITPQDSNEFVWDEQKIIELFNYIETVEGNLDIKRIIHWFKSESKQKREWEIVSFKMDDGQIIERKYPANYGLEFFIKEGVYRGWLAESTCIEKYAVHSVKRLSDREVFTVGDTLDASTDLSGANFTIGSFFVNGEFIIASPDNEMRGYSIKDWRKAIPVKQVLFTDAAGEEVCTLDRFYTVTDNFEIVYTDAVDGIRVTKPIISRSYLKREKAEEYILMNRPILSVNDILSIDNTTEILKQLAKQKIDSK